ncbi:substrate-binding periplasmic protein [Oceanobacter mangrovi]|uniref:substrate-binding periplasmic protein n=1 Tax=Oceanobacter mangrovi TaxID=2862510 RepID=UPI001C8EE6BF|nr:transporter substrate-binding domain-containing protein [Oceanobacter mangrovi]
MKALLLILAILITSPVSADPVYDKSFIKSVKLVAPDWPGLTNADGTGLYWDIVHRVYEPLGITVHTSEAAWNRAMKMVTEYYLYSGIVGEVLDTREPLVFPQMPLEMVYLYALARQGFDTPLQQAGVRVGWQKGYDLFAADSVPFEIHEFRNPEQAIEMLDKGEIDYVIDSREALLDYLKQNQREVSNYRLTRLPDGKGVYVGFYDVPSAKPLIEIYNERIHELKASGELQAIYQQYQAEMPPDSEPR